MKKLMYVCAIVAFIAFTSCTDEDKIVPKEEKKVLQYEEQSIGKGDSQTSEGGGGATQPTMDDD